MLRTTVHSVVQSIQRSAVVVPRMQSRFLSSSTSRNFGKRVLVTGAAGQIGTELVPYLEKSFGAGNVIASDVKLAADLQKYPFCYLDVTNPDMMARVVLEQRIDVIVHLASILSAIGEQNPQLALKINIKGSENVLEVALRNKLQVFIPSTIAAFGPSTPQDMTPDLTIMRPTTVYGVSKVYVELLGEYYNRRYGLDFRSLRYPGIISHTTVPGGGTTDYAVEIYYEALKKGSYQSFLGENSKLPMMYMPDCLKATLDLIEADNAKLTQRVYNVTAMSFTPKEVAASIAKVIPGFTCTYKPDFRQKIADTWPRSLDDSKARADWGWNPDYDLDKMTVDMLANLKKKI